MLKYSKNGISVLAVLDRRRAKRNGLYPEKIEVVFGREQKYYPVGLDLSEDEWMTVNHIRADSVEKSLIGDAFLRIVREAEDISSLGHFSFYSLDFRLGRHSARDSLNSALQERAGSLKAEGRTNSYYRCRSTLKAVEQFAGGNVRMSEISAVWLRRCENFWLAQGKSMTTVGIYMKTIKSEINAAINDGFMTAGTNPFGRRAYRVPKGTERRLALTKEQLCKVMAFKGSPRLEECRDLWLFSYLCNGINFRDMIYLRYRNIVGGEICFVRAKTRLSSHGKPIRAALTPKMLEIIERTGNPYDGNPDTYIFRCCDGSTDDYGITMNVRKVVARCNRALASIATSLGIPKFTTYSARHSFASILNWQGIDISYISESLGHTSLNTTRNYLAGFTKEDRVRNAELLTDFNSASLKK